MRFQKVDADILINNQEALILAFLLGTVQGALEKGLPIPKEVLEVGGIKREEIKGLLEAVRVKFTKQASTPRL